MPGVPTSTDEHGNNVEEHAASPTVTHFPYISANIPDHVLRRHINQHQWTADGNFHLNKYTKNSDPDDVSIYDGRAYFPRDEEYQTYLKNCPPNTKEVFQFRLFLPVTDSCVSLESYL